MRRNSYCDGNGVPSLRIHPPPAGSYCLIILNQPPPPPMTGPLMSVFNFPATASILNVRCPLKLFFLSLSYVHSTPPPATFHFPVSPLTSPFFGTFICHVHVLFERNKNQKSHFLLSPKVTS